nr:MAG TPA: hypothetical protein [Caudoviricetes sp.]
MIRLWVVIFLDCFNKFYIILSTIQKMYVGT